MKNISWPLVASVARLLERDEREAVLGDLAEAGEGTGQTLYQLMGLVIRRQAALWKDWRPWVAALGLSLPSSFLLMGSSLAVSRSGQRLIEASHSPGAPSANHGLVLLAASLILLLGWSWTIGCVVGSMSRRTLWASVAACCAPCLFCLERFRVESVSRYSLLLFVLPAVWGVGQSLKQASPRRSVALAVAVTVTVLMVPVGFAGGQVGWTLHAWILHSVLTWPAWYLVRTAWKPIGAEATA